MILNFLQVEEIRQLPSEIPLTPETGSPVATAVVIQQQRVSPVEEVQFKAKSVDRSLFDDSDSSDSELFKTKIPDTSMSKTEAPMKKGGLKSNAKINSSLLGSESDDSVFNSQAAIPTPIKITTPSFLLADSDDDGKDKGEIIFNIKKCFFCKLFFL